jgi:hypothetical protein
MQLTHREQQRELAEAIQAGVNCAKILESEGIRVVECPYHYLAEHFPSDGTWLVCAIGHAMLGAATDFTEARNLVRMVCRGHENTPLMRRHFASLLSVPTTLLNEVDEAQVNGRQKVATILSALMSGTFKFP